MSVFERALGTVLMVVAPYIGLPYPTLDEIQDPEERAYTRTFWTALKKEMEELQSSRLAGLPFDRERLRYLEDAERKHQMSLYASPDG